MTTLLEVLALLGLILLNGCFVAAEYGLVNSRRTRIRELEREGNRRARGVLLIPESTPRFIAAMHLTMDTPPRFMGAVHLGVAIPSLAFGAVGEPLLAHLFEPLIATVLAV